MESHRIAWNSFDPLNHRLGTIPGPVHLALYPVPFPMQIKGLPEYWKSWDGCIWFCMPRLSLPPSTCASHQEEWTTVHWEAASLSCLVVQA